MALFSGFLFSASEQEIIQHIITIFLAAAAMARWTTAAITNITKDTMTDTTKDTMMVIMAVRTAYTIDKEINSRVIA